MNSSNLELWLKLAMSLLLGLTIAVVLSILLGIDYGRVLAYIQPTTPAVTTTPPKQIPRSAYSRSTKYRRPQSHRISEPTPITLDRDSSISRYRDCFEIMLTALAPYNIDADPVRYREIHWAIHRVTIALGDYGIVNVVTYLALLQGLYDDPDKKYLCDDWTSEQRNVYRAIDWAAVNWAKLQPAFARVTEVIDKLKASKE